MSVRHAKAWKEPPKSDGTESTININVYPQKCCCRKTQKHVCLSRFHKQNYPHVWVRLLKPNSFGCEEIGRSVQVRERVLLTTTKVAPKILKIMVVVDRLNFLCDTQQRHAAQVRMDAKSTDTLASPTQISFFSDMINSCFFDRWLCNEYPLNAIPQHALKIWHLQ